MSNKQNVVLLAIASAAVATVAQVSTAQAETDEEYAKRQVVNDLWPRAQELRNPNKPFSSPRSLETDRYKKGACKAVIKEAKKAGVKDTDVLQHEYFDQHPNAVKVDGGRDYQITLADAAWYCEQHEQFIVFQGGAAWVRQAAEILARSVNPPTEESTKDYNDGAGDSSVKLGKSCVAGVDAALAGGIAPDRTIELASGTVTMGEAKSKYCEALIEYGKAFEDLIDKRLRGDVDKIRAKYAAAGIKGKRLDLFVEYDSVYWRGKGCEIIDDLKVLAKAKKLYQWLENDDGTHTIRTYTFKGNNYTVKDKTYKTEAKAYKGCK